MAFNGRFVLNIIDFAADNGLNPHELSKKTGKSIQELGNEDCTISNDAYDALLSTITLQTGNLHFGLQSAEHLGMAASGVVGQITQSCKTVKEALIYCCYFANLGCSSLPMQLHKIENGYKLEIIPNALWLVRSPESVRQTAEGMVAYTIKQFNQLTLQKNYPNRIDFIWEKPESTEMYDQYFKCKIEYTTPAIAIYLSETSVDREIKTSNYDLLRILVAHAHKRMENLNEHRELDKIKRAILKMANPYFPDIERTARFFNLSKRTLQRRLEGKGYTYRNLIEEMRKDLADEYIKNKLLSQKEIAYLLGYSEVSAFNRSFKRWYGTTINQFKQ